ncbi:two-component response regulator arr2 [Phtheirospermum japonicum]|uniref:Two-component response regulator arr2 n=1 Tax=Phtheirospermum japonicum TaxID=374723 RepID=A0A830BRY8_9LAMI|nr:two-component response regulator arr2 [Phtheirospermum japonicum]
MESEGLTLTNSCPHELKKPVDAISILVVDDDTTCLSIVAAILKKFKYEVVTVKHANDALCTLRIKSGAFDLVVSDVHMPDMNGFELQQAIAQEFNNLPVVLMSADDKEGVALKGLEGGAAFFIYKPVCADDVRDLWQFAAMRKKSKVVIDDETQEKINCNETTIISVSSSSVNEENGVSNKDSKKISPTKEGSDAKKGETSSSQKKPKIIWTNSLHNRFLEAIRSIGLDSKHLIYFYGHR